MKNIVYEAPIGSKVLIVYLSQKEKVREGEIVEKLRNCVKIKTVIFKIGPVKFWTTRWYYAESDLYKLVVD